MKEQIGVQVVLKHQALNTKGKILVHKKSFEDLEDDMIETSYDGNII